VGLFSSADFKAGTGDGRKSNDQTRMEVKLASEEEGHSKLKARTKDSAGTA
jgi:hypothetical protein